MSTARRQLSPPPSQDERRPLPVLVAVLPVLVGFAGAVFTHDPYMLAMCAMSPVMLIGNHLAERARYSKSYDLNRATGRRAGEPGPSAPLARRLVAVAARHLPAAERARYSEEFRSELAEIARAGGGRRAQLAYGARQVMSAVRLRAALRSPRQRSAAP